MYVLQEEIIDTGRSITLHVKYVTIDIAAYNEVSKNFKVNCFYNFKWKEIVAQIILMSLYFIK